MVSPSVVRTDQANAYQHQVVTTMALKPPQQRDVSASAAVTSKPLNFFGLDQQECRNYESRQRQQATKQNANDSVEEA